MSAPPGYNPEVSLLAGGTGEIARVMGGGGTAPPGFNETATLLTGGENAVIRVVEGGAVTFANEHGKPLATDLSGAVPPRTDLSGAVPPKTVTTNKKQSINRMQLESYLPQMTDL